MTTPIVDHIYSLYSRWEVQNVRGYNSVLEHAIDAQFAALDSSPFVE